jgi:hypothetical protein
MKKFMITLVLLALFATSTNLLAQTQSNESLGLPGDNLNLFAVMKLFQESETLEGFEKNLNDPNSHINNLDLNGDNYVDYIRVIDNIDGDVHTIVMQVAINERENQDVAVFTVQRDRDGRVQIQLTGDESLYGQDYIIEPNYADAGQTPNPGYMGNNQNITIVRTSPEVIATWPVIRFIYMPNYVVWHSSWHYNYYPSYWQPWSPYYWDYYYGYQYNWYNHYYGHYRRVEYHRYTGWNDHYYSTRRSQSPNVSIRIREGSYKSTYSRPDQRKDGEALYRKSNPEQNAGRSNQSPGNNQGRRPDANSSTNSRRANTGTNTQGTRTMPQQNNGTTRRASATTNQSGNRPTQQQNTGTTRRAPAGETTKPAVKSSASQNSSTPRQNSERAVNNSQQQQRNVAKPVESRRPASVESSRPSAGTREQKSSAPAVKSSDSKRGNKTRTESTAKPTKKASETESAKPERSR